jgi:hypothetical protein
MGTSVKVHKLPIPCERHILAAADVPTVTAILEAVEHLLPMLAQAPSPTPKKNLVDRSWGNMDQYRLLAPVDVNSGIPA